MKSRVAAFSHAMRGLKTFFAETIHARIHLLAAIAVIALGFKFPLNTIEWICILLCITLVFVAEAINSSIEYAIDLVTLEMNPLAKKAKDVSAAAVLIAAIFSVIIAFLIFYPKIF